MKKYYVKAIDNFMSGLGKSEGKKNVLIFECEGRKEAENVKSKLKDREEMSSISVHSSKPSYDNNYYYESYKTKENAAWWYK